MSTVFVGGSRRISRVNALLVNRLENIVTNKLDIIIGDANGFDRAAQTFFHGLGYRSVTVYCTNGKCRNNVGHWPIYIVNFQGRGRGREFYTAKDDAMIQDADYGLFAWDGKSKGTIRNVEIMAKEGKPSAIYVSSARMFTAIRSVNDLQNLDCDQLDRDRCQADLFNQGWREVG